MLTLNRKIKRTIDYNVLIIVILLSLFLFKFHSLFAIAIVAALLLTTTFRTKLLKTASYLSLFATASITIIIILSLVTQTIGFFKLVSPMDFFFGTVWEPNYTIQNGEIKKLFGIIPLALGTLLISSIAILIGAPSGIASAIFLTYFTSERTRHIIKPLIEAMAGIPTVVYGYFALNFISPLVKKLGHGIGLDISTESALSAGIVIGIMIVPLIASLVDDILHSIPKSLYYGAAALGSTQTEIIFRIILPYSLPGIFSMVLLAFSRAIGETMIVLMLTGVSAHLDINPFHPITTITVQVVTILTGDQTFNSPESLSAYALGLTLFIFTWALNSVAITLINKTQNK